MKKTNETNVTSRQNLEISERERVFVGEKSYSVYATDNYDVFKKLKGNRPVESARYRKILNSIKLIGWMHNPIVVNEKFEIIDGQGRFKALKTLSLPIEYILIPGLGLEECKKMNENSTTWNSRNFIVSEAELGNENYQRLLNLEGIFHSKKNNVCSINTITVICLDMIGNGGNGSATKSIKDGSFVLTEQRYYEVFEMLDYLKELDFYIKKSHARKGLIQTCITWSLEHTDATKEGFMEMMKQNYGRFLDFSKVRDMLGLIQSFYNENKCQKDQVDFLGYYDNRRNGR